MWMGRPDPDWRRHACRPAAAILRLSGAFSTGIHRRLLLLGVPANNGPERHARLDSAAVADVGRLTACRCRTQNCATAVSTQSPCPRPLSRARYCHSQSKVGPWGSERVPPDRSLNDTPGPPSEIDVWAGSGLCWR